MRIFKDTLINFAVNLIVVSDSGRKAAREAQSLWSGNREGLVRGGSAMFPAKRCQN